MPERIALCVIVNDETDENWERMLRSAMPHVDQLFIGYTGSDQDEDIPNFRLFNLTLRLSAELDCPVMIRAIGWDKDFARARNDNFAMVPKDDYDWIMWLDSDDALEGGDNILAALDALPSKVKLVFAHYIYAFDQKTGEVKVEQPRERFFRTDIDVQWFWIIHETCNVPPGVMMSEIPKEQVAIRHWRDVFGPDNKKARDRNRDMLVEALRDNPEAARYALYLAHEVFAEAQRAAQDDEEDLALQEFHKAFRLYERYISKFGGAQDDDPYQANCRMAECLRIMGRWNDAVDRDLQGIKMRPTYPEAYVGVAEGFYGSGNPDKAIEWADAAIRNSLRAQTFSATETQALEYTPHFIKARSFEQMGQFQEAAAEFEICMEISPHLNDLTEAIAEARRKHKIVRKATNERKRFHNTGKGKSIAFYTNPLFETWHPEKAKVEGSGGAEMCVMEIARRFAFDGWRTVVFGTPGANVGYYEEEGVEYWNAQEFDANENFEVFVGSRAPHMFEMPMRANKKLLWMHDVNTGQVPFSGWGDVWTKMDGVIGLTDWHCNHLSKLYGIDPGKMIKIHNGFDPAQFTSHAKDPHKFVFSSSPDRGVDVLLSMWPEIRKLYGDATLDIFYGWTGIDRILQMQPDHPIQAFKNHVVGLSEDLKGEGVTWHNRVTRAELAKHYETTAVWAYPTYFMETFCITALEMQAAGVIPATSNLAGLKETVACPELMINGFANNFDYHKRYMDLIQMVVETETAHEEWQQRGYDHVSQFTWDKSFDVWRSVVGQPVLV